MSVNVVMLQGGLVRDPELRYTPEGLAITEFTLGFTKYIKGRQQKHYSPIKAVGKTAENICQNLKKGSQVIIQGELQLDQWEKDGKKYSKLKVFCTFPTFLSTESNTQSNNNTSSFREPEPDEDYLSNSTDDDVPF